MSNVVHLPEKRSVIWICNCRCSTFELHDDGTARCAACGDVARADGATVGGWYPDIKGGRDAELLPEPIERIESNGSVDFSRRRVANQAAADDVIMIFVVKADGTRHLWTNAETDEDVDLAKYQLDRAKGMF